MEGETVCEPARQSKSLTTDMMPHVWPGRPRSMARNTNHCVAGLGVIDACFDRDGMMAL